MQCLFALVFVAESIAGLSAPVENTISSILTQGSDYDATAVVANGFPNSEDAFSELQGKYYAGGLADLRSSDDGYFEIESALLPGNGWYASLRADFVIDEPSTEVTKLEILTAAHVAQNSSRTGMLFAFNWKLAKYEFIGAYQVLPTDKNQTVTIEENASSYVSAEGDVRIAIRGHRTCSLGLRPSQMPFRLSFNLLRLKVSSPTD